MADNKKPDFDLKGIIKKPLKNVKDKPNAVTIAGAPSDYIVVNDPSLTQAKEEHSCVILFDWVTFINSIIGVENSTFKDAYEEAVNNVLENLGIESYASEIDSQLNEVINKSLLDFNVTLTNRLGGNSCSFTLENFDDKWIIKTPGPFYGQSVIQEGLRFTIDVRGRFDTGNFYRVYTGAISEVKETVNPVDRKLSFSATDPSRFLSYTRYNVHPAIYETDLIAKQKDPTFWSSNMQGVNGGELIRRLIDPDYDADKRQLKFPYLWTVEPSDEVEKLRLSAKKGEGKPGVGLPVDSLGLLDKKYRKNWHTKRSARSTSEYKYNSVHDPKLLMWGHTGTLYQLLFGSMTLYFSEFKTKQDIINDITNLTYFVSYVDGAGNLHYHPPRFEEEAYLDLTNGISDNDDKESSLTDSNKGISLIYSIFDDEIISQSYSQNDKEVVTVCKGIAEGGFGIWDQIEEQVAPNTYKATVIWKDGINRFGYREAVRSTAALKNEKMIDIFTAAFFLRRNQERFHMNVTMPMRPELQADRPIYDYNKDRIYYIRSVTHSYSAGSPTGGGTYTTSVTCNAGRRLDEKIASNVFAISDTNISDVKSFVSKYASYYNLEDMRLTRDQIRDNKKRQRKATQKADDGKATAEASHR